MVVRKMARGDGIRRSNDDGGRWLKGAKEAKKEKKAKTQKACRGAYGTPGLTLIPRWKANGRAKR
jgi:hypothetical protein